MFINFWYPVVLGHDLGEKPQKVQMLGCDFVVYRGASGQAVCLANTCAHRNPDKTAERIYHTDSSLALYPELPGAAPPFVCMVQLLL